MKQRGIRWAVRQVFGQPFGEKIGVKPLTSEDLRPMRAQDPGHGVEVCLHDSASIPNRSNARSAPRGKTVE